MMLQRLPDKLIKKVQYPATSKSHLVSFDEGEHKDVVVKCNEKARPDFYRALQKLVPIFLRITGIHAWDPKYDEESMVGTRLTMVEFAREDQVVQSVKFTLENWQDGVSQPTKLQRMACRDLSESGKRHALQRFDFDAIAALEREALIYALGGREFDQLNLVADEADLALEFLDDLKGQVQGLETLKADAESLKGNELEESVN